MKKVRLALENAHHQINPPGMTDLPVITVDCPVTRRRYIHVIDWPAGNDYFASTDFADLLEKLKEEGYAQAAIIDGREAEPSIIGILSVSDSDAFLYDGKSEL